MRFFMSTEDIMTITEMIDFLEDGQLDDLEARILTTFPVIEFALKHTFTPGLYSREIFMPAGSLLTSKIHKTEHPYVILTGCVRVLIPGKDIEILEAGYSGITKPNTRRVLYIEEDCRWITFHPLSVEEELARENSEDATTIVDMVENRIIEKRVIPGMGELNMNDIYNKILKEQAEGAKSCLG